MNQSASSGRRIGVALATLLILSAATATPAAELLVADRLTNRVVRYDETGAFLGVLVDDSANLSEPNGLALSPSGDALYVTSRQNSSVVRYDYNGTSASNPTVVVDSGVSVPAGIIFDDDRFLVANLGFAFDADAVSQFNPDGTSAGDDLTGGAPTGRTGLAIAPDGALLAGSFQNGEVLKFNESSGEFENFIGPDQSLTGVGNLLTIGDDLYVAAGFAGTVFKFDATSGAPDATFTPITNLEFPASLAPAPDGNGILVGILGLEDGAGRIDQYASDGGLIGTFAINSSDDPSMGFSEAAGLLTVTAAAGSADLDADGDVDGADLLLIQRDDPSLIAKWQTEFGRGVAGLALASSQPNAQAIPEPMTGLAALAAAVCCAAARRRGAS